LNGANVSGAENKKWIWILSCSFGAALSSFPHLRVMIHKEGKKIVYKREREMNEWLRLVLNESMRERT
jgi:cell division protein FtsL